jgi:hypothetical protein
MTSNLRQQRELPPTTSRDLNIVELAQTNPRTVSRTGRMGEQLRLQLDLDTVEDDELYGLERHIHLRLMSKFDHWNTDHLAKWLLAEFKGKWSIRSIYYALKGLRQKRYLARTARRIPTAGKTVWYNGYQVFEVPPPAPEGYDPDEAIVVTIRKYCDSPNNRPPDYKKRVFGTMPGGRKAKKSNDKAAPAHCKILHTNKGWKDVPHNSEHPKYPKSPCGGLGSIDEFRVCDYDCPDGKPDETARGAKRRKGRKSPAKPHNARGRNKPQGSRTPKGPQNQRMTRIQFNRSGFRSEADTRDFMANLTTRLQPAFNELSTVTRFTTAANLEVLRKNPLVAVAQEVWGYQTWEHKDLRRFLRILGNRLPLADFLLFWLADNNRRWIGQVPFDMRDRLDRNHPTDPDVRRNQIYPDIVEKLYHWQAQMDACRDWLGDLMVRAVDSYLDGFDPYDLTTVATNPLVWTVLINSPAFCEIGLSDEQEAWIRQTVASVSAEEVRAWVDEVSANLPCRWNGQWWAPGRTIAGTVFALGVDEITGESLPADMVEWSPYYGDRHLVRTSAWSAEVPIPVEELLL